jgi:flagellar assembly protein FliH
VEGMILLSNLIKSVQVQGLEKENSQRLIKAKPISPLYSSTEKAIEKNERTIEELELDYEKQKELLQDDIHALELSYQDLQNQLIQAREEAEREIEEWWQTKQEEAAEEARKLADDATNQGFQEGYEKGYRQIQQELEQKVEETTRLIELAFKENKKIVQQSESFLLSISVKIAKKIIQQELKQHSEQIVATVQAGLKQVMERGEILIQISPDDYSLILSHAEELERFIDSDSVLRIIPDHTLSSAGGCRIQTPNGSYDVTVDSQLKAITKQLMAYYEEGTTE